jgi:hypothetical protein
MSRKQFLSSLLLLAAAPLRVAPFLVRHSHVRSARLQMLQAQSLKNVEDLSEAEIAAMMDDIDGTEILAQYEQSKNLPAQVSGLVNRDLSDLSDAEVAAMMDDMDDLSAFEAQKKQGSKRKAVRRAVSAVGDSIKSIVANEMTATAPAGAKVDIADLSDAEIAAMMDDMDDLSAFEEAKQPLRRSKRKAVRRAMSAMGDSFKSIVANEMTATAPAGAKVDIKDLSDAEIAAMMDDMEDLSAFEEAKKAAGGPAAEEKKESDKAEKAVKRTSTVMEDNCI